MAKKIAIRIVFGTIFIAWIGISLAAVAGLGKLWWERERAHYWGSSVVEQREQIWQNAGLPLSLLPLFSQAQQSWPQGISYEAVGDHNALSYGKYLLVPRIPAGSDTYRISDQGELAPAGSSEIHEIGMRGGSGYGFVLSLLTLLSLALATRRITGRNLSIPESIGICALLVMGAVTISRGIATTASYGFAIIVVLALVGVIISWSDCKRAYTQWRWSPSARKNSERSRLLIPVSIILGVILVCFCTWSYLMSVVVVPDDWDAWAIWGAKAKVLALGSGPLRDVTHFGHADYPLLWPSIWAFSGWLGGGWEEMWSRGWGPVFMALTGWEIAVIINRLSANRVAALLGAALFVSMPAVSLVASWSYAEAPFWLLITACFGRLLCLNKENGLQAPLFLGILAAAAAYTKNEGVFYAIIILVFVPFLSTPVNRWRNLIVCLFFFGLCYGPWFWWTTMELQLGSHATAGLGLTGEQLARAVDRIPAAVDAITNIWGDIRQWNIVLWVCLGYAFLALIAGKRKIFALVALAILGGYFVIILFHPAEIYWQVGTAWNRLTIHAMPLLVIGLVTHSLAILRQRG